MNKIAKILLVLVSSLSISVSAIAGELTVTGSAKASYSIGGEGRDDNKGFGITNEIGLGATGELDNGFTWSYAIALDPSGVSGTAGSTAGTAVNDDQSLTLTTPYGTVGMFITAGGLSGEHGAGIGAVGTGDDLHSTMSPVYGSDISTYQNVQYHLPAGLLPFGIGAKIGYAPNLTNNDSYAADFKTPGRQDLEEFGDSATHYQVSAAPIAGLSLQADYFETSGGNTPGQKPTAGNISAKYTMGPVTVGYRKNFNDPADTSKDASITNYENDAYGVQFAVNDALSISYYVEKHEARTRAAIATGAAKAVKTSVESEVKYIQAAYNIGGATVGISNADASNSDYTTAQDESATMLTFAVAF